MSAPGPIEVVVGVGAAAPQRAPEPDTFETPDPLVAEGLVSDNKETSLYSTSMGGIGGGATSAASNFQKQVESGNLTLDKTSVSSKEALEHFSKLERAGPTRFASKQTEFELLQARYRKFESPLQRFQRLQIEINEFKQDLEEVAKEDPKKAIDQGVTPTELLGELSNLQSQLQSLMKSEEAQRAINRPLVEVSTKDATQQKLSETLLKELQNLSGSAPAPSTTSSAAPSDNDRVTYELYYRPGVHQGRDAQAVRLLELEKRIAGLESVLSGQSKLKNPLSTTVVAALEELERRVGLLDENKLEMLKVKLQSLTFNMEDAILKSQEHGNKSSTQKVDQLYDLVLKWDGTWQQLPVVVSRLQALRRIHEQCAFVAETVAKLEQDQAQLSSAVSSNAAFLQQLQANFHANLTTINENIALLQSRVDKLLASPK